VVGVLVLALVGITIYVRARKGRRTKAQSQLKQGGAKQEASSYRGREKSQAQGGLAGEGGAKPTKSDSASASASSSSIGSGVNCGATQKEPPTKK
jgi:hypothetical protein